MGNQTVRDQAVGCRFGQIINIGNTGGINTGDNGLKCLPVGAANLGVNECGRFVLFCGTDKTNLLHEHIAVGFVDQQLVIGVGDIVAASTFAIWH